MAGQQSFQELIEEVRRVISDAINAELEDVGVDTPIYAINNEEDYALVGGLMLAEANIGVENAFHIDIPDQDAVQLTTVRDYAHYINRHRTQVTQTEQTPTRTEPAPRKRRASVAKETKEIQPSHIWTFDMGHWEQTEEASPEDSQKALRMSPEFSLGTKEHGFSAQVYKNEHPKSTDNTYGYLVKLQIGQDIELIHVTDLPSLISLLNRLSNIVQATDLE